MLIFPVLSVGKIKKVNSVQKEIQAISIIYFFWIKDAEQFVNFNTKFSVSVASNHLAYG